MKILLKTVFCNFEKNNFIYNKDLLNFKSPYDLNTLIKSLLIRQNQFSYFEIVF